MIDNQHLVQGRGRTEVFNAQGGVTAQGVQTWYKPRNATMINFVVVGGGGGGGSGHQRTSGSAGGGGGGGASSGIARFLVPAIFVPDVLYLYVGNGGKGGIFGVASGAGSSGLHSYISTCPPPTAGSAITNPNIYMNSGVNVAGAGGGGAVGSAGTAGAVPTVAVVQPHHIVGNWLATVGLVGFAGGAVTGATGGGSTAQWTALPLTSGAGGGGIATTTEFAGGDIKMSTAFVSTGRLYVGLTMVGGGVGGSGNGNAGVKSLAPFLNTGGGGGGTANAGIAGNGGKGGYGCGGGGGGAGQTAGNGGNGGDGIIIISSW